MTKEKMRIKRLDPAFRARERAYDKVYHKKQWADPVFQEKTRQYKRSKYESDPAYRAAVLARNNKWNVSEKGRNAARVREHRRREMEGQASLTHDDWKMILDFQEYRCVKCWRSFQEAGRPERDHIVSVVDGGTLTITNTQALCRSCNSSKHSSSIDYRDATQRSFCAWMAGEAEMVSVED